MTDLAMTDFRFCSEDTTHTTGSRVMHNGLYLDFTGSLSVVSLVPYGGENSSLIGPQGSGSSPL